MSCPHYLAEIVVYAGLALVACGGVTASGGGGGSGWPGAGVALLLAWVCANLWVTARRTHAWYAATFRGQYTRLGRAALFPKLQWWPR